MHTPAACADFATAFARLLSDRAMRVRFRDDANELAQQFGLAGTERSTFIALDADDLDTQADGLISKRMREVSRRIPHTWRRLGSGDARRLFRMYAARQWPTGHRRHDADALSFIRYLLDQGVPDVCQAERNQLDFHNTKRRFRVKLVHSAVVAGNSRPAVQILYRWRREPCSLLLYLRKRTNAPHQACVAMPR